MIRKIFGVILLLAGIGNFIGCYAKTQTGKPNPAEDIGYGIFFLGLGVFLMLWKPKPKNTDF